jgi:hypothetical protein
MKIVQIDGGMGRVLCATAAINKMSREHETIVITSFPEIFFNHPNLHKIYNLSREYLWDDVIKNGEFLNPEPYHNHLYYNQKHHLSQSFNYLLNGDSSFSFPQVFLTPQELSWAASYIDNIKVRTNCSHVIGYQPFGAGCVANDPLGCVDASNRSLSGDAARFIAENIKYTLLNLSHVPINLPNVWQGTFTTREYLALAAHVDSVLTVDSFLSHAAAAFGKTGVLLLGATHVQNVGYPNYRTCYRDGFPKAYYPNRFAGFVDKSKDAMHYNSEDLHTIIDIVNNRDFPQTFDDVAKTLEVKPTEGIAEGAV